MVTANKSLLARHGGELRAAAAKSATPLLYEAAVLAGVPFLGTFARRPHAAAVTSLVGIANGTSNFVLTRCAARRGPASTRRSPTRNAAAMPSPIRATTCRASTPPRNSPSCSSTSPGATVDPDAIETERHRQPSRRLRSAHARELGGAIKPVVCADWTNGIEAFAGPAFVPLGSPAARVDGVENAMLLGGAHGRLLFQGPGAGPEVTAATVLDDVREIAAGVAPAVHGELRRAAAGERRKPDGC